MTMENLSYSLSSTAKETVEKELTMLVLNQYILGAEEYVQTFSQCDDKQPYFLRTDIQKHASAPARSTRTFQAQALPAGIDLQQNAGASGESIITVTVSGMAGCR